jgi:hypothetical protein
MLGGLLEGHRGLATGCPADPAFNIAATSGFYAQMAGLLAGFAFTAIIFLLSSPTLASSSKRQPEKSGVVLTLFAAMVALVISTLTYSVLAGEQEARGRAAVQELTDGLPFALAIMMLFHGVTRLMSGDGWVDDIAIRTGQAITGVITPVLAMFYLVSATLDNEHARIATLRESNPAFCGDVGLVNYTGFGLVLLLLTILVITWIRTPSLRSREWAHRWRAAVPLCVLAVSVASAVLAGVVSMQKPAFGLPSWAVVVFLSLSWLIFAVLALLVLWDRAASAGRAPAEAEDERQILG